MIDDSVTVGEYFYDGDGRRVKKYVPATGEVTVFVYDAMGKLVAEYSTVVASATNAKVAYLTNDHLGSPRIITDKNGNVTARHDYHPFGEEITASRTAGLGYADDTVRKQFTGYERDKESELDFAEARMYSSPAGRFTTTDPLYYQLIMAVDPQRFNLYVYTRNNPLKWVDPKGEDVRIRGANTINSLYEMAGGQEEFDKYFVVNNGVVSIRENVLISEANSGVQNLAGLVGASETYLFYVGNSFRDIADLFEGATDERGNLTQHGRQLRERFEGSDTRIGGIGTLVGVRGRPNSDQRPGLINGDPLFAVFAFNSDVSITQTGVATRPEYLEPFPSGRVTALSSQIEGIGQAVRASSFFIHEGAEAQMFNRIGFVDKFGNNNYGRAHRHGQVTEERLRNDLKLTGGFSGGSLDSRRRN